MWSHPLQVLVVTFPSTDTIESGWGGSVAMGCWHPGEGDAFPQTAATYGKRGIVVSWKCSEGEMSCVGADMGCNEVCWQLGSADTIGDKAQQHGVNPLCPTKGSGGCGEQHVGAAPPGAAEVLLTAAELGTLFPSPVLILITGSAFNQL